MKVWEVVWDEFTARSTVRARDVEHAIRVWKRDHKNVNVRSIVQVWKVSR